MKLLLIRHGDPDYKTDSLTERGRSEAKLLAERIAAMNVKAYYTSPMGRARETAGYTLEKAGGTAEVLDWAREFDMKISDGSGGKCMLWDLLPENWTKVPEYYDKDKWLDVQVMKDADIKPRIMNIYDGLDDLLERHGYKREGNFYRALNSNDDTVALFCHYGVTCAMLSHLLNISPMLLWLGVGADTTAVTTLVTEERRKGIATFRMTSFGDVSHLNQKL